MTGFKNSVIYSVLFLLPKNLVSNLMGRLVSLKLPASLALYVNQIFARMTGITISEAEKPLNEYPTLQDFFIRRLKSGLRPIDPDKNAVVSPCDGFLCEAGPIIDGRLCAVKGKYYSLRDLVDSESLASRFLGGYFATIYLSPRDYHRFHAPVSGDVKETIYIPGALWPVNPWSVANVKDLFCINERIISLIAPEGHNKLIAHIAVGATMVGKIKLEYCDTESNVKSSKKIIPHPERVGLNKGQELGMFMFGSTIVLLFEPGLINGLTINTPTTLRMGERLALLN